MTTTTLAAPPLWVQRCGYGAIAAALPTVIWRLLPGLGLTMGTPSSWREAQQLPGAGTAYVVFLSVLELGAALLTLVLIRPGADCVRGRRFPTTLVAAGSGLGVLALTLACVGSIVAWHNVDPFAGEPVTGWSVLADACYLAALAWPVLLTATTIGYVGWRRASS